MDPIIYLFKYIYFLINNYYTRTQVYNNIDFIKWSCFKGTTQYTS